MKKTVNLIVLLLLLASPFLRAELHEDLGKLAKNREYQIRAEKYEKEGNFKAAGRLYRLAMKVAVDFPEKARFLLKSADCYFEANKSYKAMEAYKELVQGYALYIDFEHVVDRIRQLSEKMIEGDGTFLSIKDRSAGIDGYFLLLIEAPAINVSLKDRLRLARLLVDSNRREEAVSVYQEILKLDETLDDVRLELALLLVDMCKYGDGDGTIRRAATMHASMILKHNPNYPRKDEIELILTDAKEIEANRLLEMGKFYLRPTSMKPKAAKQYLTDLVNNYPGTKAAWEGKNLLDTNENLK